MAKQTFNDPTSPVLTATVGTPTPADGDVWNTKAAVRLGKNLDEATSAAVLMVSGNSNGNATGSQQYEHMGIYSTMTTNKNAAGGIFYDVVGGDFRGIIRGATSGRAFGSYSWAQVEDGSDGFLVGHEIGIRNQGSDQSGFGTHSKYGLKIVAEIGSMTAAVHISKGGVHPETNPRIHHGVYVADGALTGVGGVLRGPNNSDLLVAGSAGGGADRRLFKLGGDNVCYIGEDAVGTKIGIRDVSFNYIGLKLIMAGAPDSGGAGRRVLYCEN